MKILAITLILWTIIGSEGLYSQVYELPYYNLEGTCNLTTNQIIANSLDEVRKLTDCNLVRFDFNKYTIIGIKGSSPGHFIPNINFRISKSIDFKTIEIEVTISGGEACNCRVVKPSYRKMIYFDKIEEDYIYEFKYVIIDE